MIGSNINLRPSPSASAHLVVRKRCRFNGFFTRAFMLGRLEQLGVVVSREKIGQAIRKLIEDRGARSFGARTEIYSAARNALRKATNDEPATMADLDQVIDEIETSLAPRREAKRESGDGRGGGRRALPTLLAGVVLGGLVTAAVMAFGFQFRPFDPVAATLMRQYNATAPLLPAAVDYLHKVADAVAEMQKTSPEELETKASHRFIPVSTLDPALWKQFPKSMPPGSSVVLRADKSGYKVLFNWTLCGAAYFAKPEMVDPVRARAGMLGCPYFGLWTPGAAKW
jgi:hypothetical protein